MSENQKPKPPKPPIRISSGSFYIDNNEVEQTRNHVLGHATKVALQKILAAVEEGQSHEDLQDLIRRLHQELDQLAQQLAQRDMDGGGQDGGGQ